MSTFLHMGKEKLLRANQLMTPFWLFGWALALATGWLLPNHYAPWTTFEMDAWVAGMLVLASAAVLARTGGPATWHGITILSAALVVVPMLQYALGLVWFFGTAWVCTAYLMGLLLALLIGARWESASLGQLGDGLFLAIGVAALLSVGVQLHQWLALDSNFWAIGATADGSSRPSANFGQPNQLATFLLWGLLAVAWGVVRRRIGVVTALLMALYLLFGIALTASRTAWVALVLLVCASWAWRRLWPNRRWPWMTTGLGVYFAICVISTGWLYQLLQISSPSETGDIVRMSGELRPMIWAMFLDAVLQHPWLGYGWNQVGLAQLAVALDHPSLRIYLAHSHNLFLDLMLWCGIPVGLFVSVYLIRWLWQRLRAVRCAEDAVLLLFVIVVGNHAMFELPLHQAYFLLPVGLVMGALHVRLNVRPILVAGRWSVIAVWLVAVVLLGLIIRDYFRVETSYQAMRFELAHIKTEVHEGPPDVLLLTQWREFIRLARVEPASGMGADDLVWMRKVASTFPTTGTLYKLALTLAMNQQADEARLWLKKMCKTVAVDQCAAIKEAWANQSLRDPRIAAVPWPE